MNTQQMQKRLEMAFESKQIVDGGCYNLMPSDCSGNGFDIALKPRTDESGDYIVGGMLCRVECSCKIGSRNWREGTPIGYKLAVAPQSPYTLAVGERAVVVHRTGRSIGSGFMSRKYASIAILREDGSKVYRGHSPYWLATTSTYASHYISGLCRRDSAAYDAEVSMLKSTAEQINATAIKSEAAA